MDIVCADTGRLPHATDQYRFFTHPYTFIDCHLYTPPADTNVHSNYYADSDPDANGYADARTGWLSKAAGGLRAYRG
jgi:hypothetical protein